MVRADSRSKVSVADRAAWKDRLTRHGMGRVFRYRDFMLFTWVGFFGSVGSWLQRMGLQWLTWDLTHSYAWLGAVAFVDAIAIIIFLPIFGTVADRGDRLKLARVSQIYSMLLTMTLGVLAITGLITPVLLLVMMALHGLTEAFGVPVRLALPPALVPREELAGAIGLNSILFNLAQIIGPAIAGIIIAQFESSRVGTGVLFVLNGITTLASLWSLYVIRLMHEENLTRARSGFFADLKEGFFYAFTKEGLSLFIVFMVFTHLLMRSFRELLAGYADGHFHMGAEGLATLSGAVGLGATVGALIVANYGSVKGMMRLLFIVLTTGIILQFCYALIDIWWVVVVCAAGLGVTLSITGAGSQVLVQSAIHSAMRGRVMGLWAQIQRGCAPMGAWIIGMVASQIDFQYTLAGATALYLLVFLMVVPRYRFLARHMEAPPEDRPARPAA
jgi:predicted MFS family arabinose efflux permease